MKFRFKHPKLDIFFTLLSAGIVFFLFYIFFKPTHISTPPQILPYQNSALAIEVRVSDLLSRMTTAEKIGQIALVEKNSIHDLNDITRYNIGALLSGSGGNPKDNTPSSWLKMVNNFQTYSHRTRLGIPLLYGVDANHGHGNIPGATIFPHFIGLGATHDPDLVRKIAEATAEEVAVTGIYWIFSPDLDVAQDLRWGRTFETFGSDSKLVGILGQAYIEGLQSYSQDGFNAVGSAKHYVGYGSTLWGTSVNKNYSIDQGNSIISDKELRQIHLEPFKQAITAGVKTIMASNSSWHGLWIPQDKYLLTDVLRGELGFQGLVFCDWYGAYATGQDNYTSLVKTINAGVDLVMLPYDYKLFTEYMNKAITNGDISLTRLDEAVTRILKVKFEIGLFDNVLADSANLKNVGSQAHRNLAREAVRKSLVLLKDNQTLPIAKNTSQILVAGSAADNLGRQFGGWTVEWQGIDGNWVPGTTILNGIQDLASPEAKVSYDLNGNFQNQKGLADIGIAVVGEKPYAEGVGDNPNPTLSADDLATIDNLRKVSKKIIVIIISGRPLDIKAYATDWDTIIAAWLPGSEGQGIADVLFGDYPFIGTLPVEWNL